MNGKTTKKQSKKQTISDEHNCNLIFFVEVGPVCLVTIIFVCIMRKQNHWPACIVIFSIIQ